MKGMGLFLMAVCASLTVCGASDAAVIKQAKNLIENKKYESAFRLLDQADPHNGKPDIVLLKEDIVLNYFVSSMNHKMFALKDLEKDEDLSKYRGQNGSFSMFPFEASQILDSLIKVYPTKYALYKGLGDYYYEVSEKYAGSREKGDTALTALIEKNYQVAIDHHIADNMVYYRDGFEYLTTRRYAEAIPLFLKSIEMKNDFADAHYNLAFAYLFTDDRQNAIKFAKNSLGLYKDKRNRSDAARMIGEVYSELKDDTNSLHYYEEAYNIDTSSYYNLKSLLSIYVRTDNPGTNKLLHTFFGLAPEKPAIYNDLATIYSINKRTDELISFLDAQLSIYKDQEKVLANLCFYLGSMYLPTDKQKAKDYFVRSKDYFSKFFDKDNEVFNALDEGIKAADGE